MLTIHASEGGASAKHYFHTGLVHGDYYAEGQERAGTWWGKGAELLGLSGSVSTRDFCRLVDNCHPTTGEQLTLRTKQNRRGGYDLTFCPSKSFSLVALMNGDERLLSALHQAVVFTLERVEEAVQARVRKDGEMADRYTGNIVTAMFLHLTARPEKGHLPDPLAHMHAYTMNGTHDPVEAVWKAVQFGFAKGRGDYFESVFHNELARITESLGYRVERRGSSWEVVGVPRGAIETLSKRAERVESVAAARGIEDPAEKAGLAARTRAGKAPEHTMEELRANWWKQLSPADAKLLARVKPGKPFEHDRDSPAHAKAALRVVHSVASHLFERSSSVPERRFLGECLRGTPGKFTEDEIRTAMGRSPMLVSDFRGERWVTHQQVCIEEQEIVEAVRRGKGRFLPVAERLAPPEGLTKDQQGAFKHVLGSRDRFTLVEGEPGTGKTTLAKSAVPVLQGALRTALSPVLGDKVVFLAPTAIASRGVLREEGFKDATTVALFLRDTALQERAKMGWVWLDEAAQCGTQDMRKLTSLVEELDARMVMVGDRNQNRSVGRGDIVQLLTRHAGVKSHRMEENIRQKGQLREVSGSIVRGEIQAGLEAMKRHGMLRARATEECYAEAGREIAMKVKAGRKVCGIVPTHSAEERLNNAVRAALAELGPRRRSRTYTCLEDTRLTAEERRDPKNYKKGQVVQFNQNVRGFRAGVRYQVVGHGPQVPIGPWKNHVMVRGKGEVVEALPFKHAQDWTLYDKKEVEVAEGDLVRMTRNTKVHSVWSKGRAILVEMFDMPDKRATLPRVELANSSVHRVTSILDNGDLILEGRKILPKDAGHFTHGFVRTSHSAQSVTVDDAVVVATEGELRPLTHGSFNVAVTRSRRSLSVYTDDVEKLARAASREADVPGAYDLVVHGEAPHRKDKERAVELQQAEEYRVWHESKRGLTRGGAHPTQEPEHDKDHER